MHDPPSPFPLPSPTSPCRYVPLLNHAAVARRSSGGGARRAWRPRARCLPPRACCCGSRCYHSGSRTRVALVRAPPGTARRQLARALYAPRYATDVARTTPLPRCARARLLAQRHRDVIQRAASARSLLLFACARGARAAVWQALGLYASIPLPFAARPVSSLSCLCTVFNSWYTYGLLDISALGWLYLF